MDKEAYINTYLDKINGILDLNIILSTEGDEIGITKYNIDSSTILYFPLQYLLFFNIDEIHAIVAHEISHLFLVTGDEVSPQSLEIMCDIMAIACFGATKESLYTGLKKVRKLYEVEEDCHEMSGHHPSNVRRCLSAWLHGILFKDKLT